MCLVIICSHFLAFVFHMCNPVGAGWVWWEGWGVGVVGGGVGFIQSFVYAFEINDFLQKLKKTRIYFYLMYF